MAQALIVIPPWGENTTGPQLDPAVIAGAAERAGHETRLLDLNALFLKATLQMALVAGSAEGQWRQRLAGLLARASHDLVSDPIELAAFSIEDVERAAAQLMGGPEGSWIEQHLQDFDDPAVVMLSLHNAAQVYWALTVTLVARKRWPKVLIIWGGTHVTALEENISYDERMGRHVDGFIVGRGELTFAALLDSIDEGTARPSSINKAASNIVRAQGDGLGTPRFGGLSLYKRETLTIPAQFVPPTNERDRLGGYRDALKQTRLVATSLSATVRFEDERLSAAQLQEIATFCDGRFSWSANASFHIELTHSIFAQLRRLGCEELTLCLSEEDQSLEANAVTETHLTRLVREATEASVALDVRCVTRFPEEIGDSAAQLRGRLAKLVGEASGKHRFTEEPYLLTRSVYRSEKRPESITLAGAWPWASALAWRRVTSASLRPGPRLTPRP